MEKGGASRCAIRGMFFDFLDDPWKHAGKEHEAARFLRDGLLVVENGRIRDFGLFEDVSPRHPGVEIVSLPGRLLLPGFIDGHVHFPQLRVMGAYGRHLLDWLQQRVFPEERKYGDRDYADKAAGLFFDALLAAGTTTCQAFTTSHPAATEAFFEEATRRDMRVITGLTGMDRFAPEASCVGSDDFYRESRRLIDRYHRKGRNLYAITPRFAVGCTEAMLEQSRRLKAEFPDCWVNTHISENPAEVRVARELFPDCPDYTAVYERYGLLGPKCTAGHGIWLSDDEMRRFSEAGAAIAFCPLSNLFLGSGLFRLGRAMDPEHPVKVALGSDIGGGNALTLLRVMEEAYKVGMCNATLLDGSLDPRAMDLAEAERNKLSPYRAYYLSTLGGARALCLDDLLGNFEPGKEADFVVLDVTAGQAAMAWRQSLAATDASGPRTVDEAAELLFGVMALGDDRNVDETWIAGRRAYKKTATA